MNITQNIYDALQRQYSIGRGKEGRSISPSSRPCTAETQFRSKPIFNEEESKIVNPSRLAQSRPNEVNFLLNTSKWSKMLSVSHYIDMQTYIYRGEIKLQTI